MRRRALLGWSLLGGAATTSAAVAASAGQREQPGPEESPEEIVRRIWPVSLEALAGTYVFAQVASPGGLWRRQAGGATPGVRQMSIHEAPESFRKQLLSGRLTLSEVTTAGKPEASEERSPSGRGLIRRYTEEGSGRLVLKGVPGIGAREDDEGAHEGMVGLRLLHQSHSNPSPSGVFKTRLAQEPTWGAATLDYADLEAFLLPKKGPDGEPRPEAEDDEAGLIIANARVMRSGYEIYAFVQWIESKQGVHQEVTGAVRLLRQEAPAGAPVDRPDFPRQLT